MVRTTHSSDRKVREAHDGRFYLVPLRLPEETERLKYLADELAAPNAWTVQRRLANGQLVGINVDASTAAEAVRIADEVHYAVNWRKRLIDTNGRKAPEDWALSYPRADIVNLRS